LAFVDPLNSLFSLSLIPLTSSFSPTFIRVLFYSSSTLLSWIPGSLIFIFLILQLMVKHASQISALAAAHVF
jgi:hypothetical protein